MDGDFAKRRMGEVKGLYYAPDIPPRLDAAVRGSYASMPADEPILMLYDDTVFGSAEDGFAVTERRICWRALGEQPATLMWSALERGDVRVEGSRVVVGAGTMPLTAWDDGLARALAEVFVEMIGQSAPDRPAYRSAEPRRFARPAELILALARDLLRGSPSVYFHPNIPRRKVASVRHVHARVLTPNEPILVLYDDTLLGSGSDGFAMTPERICWRQLLERPASVRWDQIQPASVATVDNSVQLVGGTLVLPRRNLDAHDVAQLVLAVAALESQG